MSVHTVTKRGQISFTEIRDIVRDTLYIAVYSLLVTVYTILPLLHNHVLLLVKAVSFLDDMTIVVELYSISPSRSQNQIQAISTLMS